MFHIALTAFAAPPEAFPKTAPRTAYKEVHLALPLSGISWPTLKPSLRNQQAELACPSLTSHPRSPPYLQRPDVVGKGPPRRAASSKACPRSPLVHLHSAGVMTPSVAPSAARRTHTWGTSGDSGHLGHLDGGGSSMAQIGIERNHASVHLITVCELIFSCKTDIE